MRKDNCNEHGSVFGTFFGILIGIIILVYKYVFIALFYIIKYFFKLVRFILKKLHDYWIRWNYWVVKRKIEKGEIKW